MPNAKVHAQIGAAAGAATYAAMSFHYERKMDLLEAGFCALTGMAFAALPDLIELALTPNHRSTAHSVVILLLLLALIISFCRDEDGKREEFVKMVVASAGAGYVTHLFADGCTPKGLPIFG
jgi:membrane-bound metal-dependent hydrolase YbcI (DUF457 family)